MKQKHIYRLIFFFVMAFALGSLAGKIYSHFTSDPRSDQDSTKNSQTSSASMTFQNENWGLGFQEEGKRPTGNASMEELKNYNAWYGLHLRSHGSVPVFHGSESPQQKMWHVPDAYVMHSEWQAYFHCHSLRQR